MISPTGATLLVEQGAPSESLVVESDGDLIIQSSSAPRFGIGTPTPTDELQLNAVVPEIRFVNEIDDTAMKLEYSGLDFSVEDNSDQNVLDISMEAPEHSPGIDSTGFVGIGTEQPTVNLQVLEVDAPATVRTLLESGSVPPIRSASLH